MSVDTRVSKTINYGTNQTELPDNVEFVALVAPYEKKLFNLAYRLTNSRERAEDVVQDTLVRAYRGLGKIEDRDNFKAGPWLYRIASNIVNDQGRRASLIRMDSIDEMPVVPFVSISRYDDPEKRAILQETNSEVLTALNNLPSHYRQVLIDHEVNGLSCEEAGLNQGRSRSATKSLLFRARIALKDEFLKIGSTKKGAEQKVHRGFPDSVKEPKTEGIEKKSNQMLPDIETSETKPINLKEIPQPELTDIQTTLLLVRGLDQIKGVIDADLLTLAQSNQVLRGQQIPDLEKVIASESQVKVKAGESFAFGLFIRNLGDLANQGIALPDISLLVQSDANRL